MTRILDRLALERGLPGVLRTDNGKTCCAAEARGASQAVTSWPQSQSRSGGSR